MKHPEAPVNDGARVFLFSEEKTGSGAAFGMLPSGLWISEKKEV
ncbi:hypothetical protein [Stomatobaculum longum]|nr:hypothetical protein [Stomatobaculum longum]